MIEAAILVIFPLCMIWAAITDSLAMTIANRVSVLLIVSFVVLAAASGMGWAEIGVHLAVFAGILAITFALFTFGSMGGGDAKMIAATSIWIGWNETLLAYLLIASVAGGVLTLGVLLFRKNEAARFLAGRVLGGGAHVPAYLEDDKSGVPYGIALGLAGLIVFPETEIARLAIAGMVLG